MKTITTTDFFNYLNFLDLFRISIEDLGCSFEAVISEDCEINPSNFTQTYTNKDGYPCVRLSKKDLFNETITKGFFN